MRFSCRHGQWKLAAIFLIASMMQVNTALAQRVTLAQNNVTLKQVFKEIKKQTGYDVLYQIETVKDSRRIDAQFSNTGLNEVMQKCLAGQNVDFTIDENTVVIRGKETSPGRDGTPHQKISIWGKVVDNEGSHLQGAIVRVKGTSTATVTSATGDFIINNVDDGAIIQISFVGFVTKELKATAQMGTIKMSGVEFDEVVIKAGYYTTSERARTGSIARVTAKEIERQPITSPLMALQGRVAGLDISPPSGTAASAPKVRIRGTNSLRNDPFTPDNGNHPMYIIDGIPVNAAYIFTQGEIGGNNGAFDPLSTIDPSNIESIEVLKDADATAIYGSRGANGVILITTKRAYSSNKTNFDFSVYRGAGEVSKKVKLLNTEQYLMMRREAFANDGATPQSWHSDLTLWDQTRYTDWQEELLGGVADITNVQASVSGGNANTSFRLGGSIYDEGLIFPGDFGYTRTTGHLAINHMSNNQKFMVSATVNYGADKKKLFWGNSMVFNALSLAPNAPALYTASGDLNWEPNEYGSSTWTNPLAELNRTVNSNLRTFTANGALSYAITPELSVKANVGFTDSNNKELGKEPLSYFAPEYAAFMTGTATFSNEHRESWIVEPQLGYDKNFGDHRLNALVGMTFQESITDNQTIRGGGYTSDVQLNSLAGAAYQMLVGDYYLQYRYTAAFGRIGYSYKQKYFLNLTGRRDGSSRFGPGKQFGNFGAIGAAYLFSGEKWIEENLPFLSLGKLRASYGITGNDQIEDYKYYNTYTSAYANYDGVVSLVPSSLFNPYYQWETTKKLEYAIQLGFLDDRIVAELSRYRNRSSNQLVSFSLPNTTGFDGILRNMPATIQNSGWEFVLLTRNIDTKDLQWTTSFNISANRNKLVSYPGIEESPYAKKYIVGQSLALQSRYIYTGIDPQTGFHTVLDVDNNGYINEDDAQLIDPNDKKFYGGLNNTLRYKSVELSFLLQFARQDGVKTMLSTPGYAYNQPVEVLNRWQKPGDNTDMQRFSQSNSASTIMNRARSSSYMTEDASFIRLKTLSLSYRLPQNLLQKARIEQASIFVQGQNLFTITGYSGLDPETGNYMPPLRILTLGLNVKF